ncbi:sigma-70 family RNA polymerase sigma factor [Arthrobacter sp. Sa2CUA1]|uniref:Sigma-70 family RNA polymerase sigma factor n=1 Tax=Arthrobacter gallicola TaxID=2762225 RepID=A0ABR8UXE3_9MICC|nr:sigma-70 family RNA polymerase sigma factor [Arthrobacter gallicola]MBD7996921.1 sigma-70 family RNA polymerase sigma factor [Arthrobacter gallicola]
MTSFSRPPDREQTFRALYAAVYPELIRFVQRRTYPDRAEDVAADTFLVVWRRLDDLPASTGDARAWIFGISRNILLNSRRGEQRREALGLRLVDASDVPASSEDIDLATSRIDLERAWRLLSEVHQEALGLAVFEELTSPQAAAVLGISPVAYRLRLTRARRALRLLLDHLPASSSTPQPVFGRTPAS